MASTISGEVLTTRVMCLVVGVLYAAACGIGNEAGGSEAEGVVVVVGAVRQTRRWTSGVRSSRPLRRALMCVIDA